jgi:hypothetical protein
LMSCLTQLQIAELELYAARVIRALATEAIYQDFRSFATGG